MCRGGRRYRIGRRGCCLNLLGVGCRAHLRHFEARLHRSRFRRLAGLAQALFSWRSRCGGRFTRRRGGCRSRRRWSGHAFAGFGRCGIDRLGYGWRRGRRRRGRHRWKARTQALIAVFSVRPVGDQALRQLLALGGGQRSVWRWRHARQVGIVRRLAGRQILGVTRRFRVGIVLAGAAPVTPSLDRIARNKPQHRRQHRHPMHLTPGTPVSAAAGRGGAAEHHDRNFRRIGRVPRSGAP